jgi:hypothetical protein
VAGNVTSFEGFGQNIANDTSIFELHDDGVEFNLTDLTLDFALGYEFCSDPAIIADIGFFNFTITDLDLQFNLSSKYDYYNLTLNVTSVHASIQEFGIAFDGLNDFLYVISGFINRIFGIVFARVKVLVEDYIERLVPLINKILEYVPNDIPIPGTHMHIDIGFAGNVVSKERHYLELPLSFSLQSDLFPYTEENLAVFPEFTDSGYEVEMAISQYLIDNILFQLHKNGFIHIDSGNLLDSILTVGWVVTGTGGNWTGFDSDAPCKAVL